MKEQVFKILRDPVIKLSTGENYTPGRMYLDNLFFCYTLEDEDRRLEDGINDKVYGRTAIARGKYKLVNSLSNRFKKVLPEVLGVDRFSGIRIHGGNTAEDLLGCIAVGKVRTISGIAQCASTVSKIIQLIDQAKAIGVDSYLEIE